MPPGSSHGSPGLYCLFDMRGCLRHTVDDGFLGSDHRPALVRTAGIDPDNQLLVVRHYCVGQNDAEDADLIPVRPCFFQEQPCLTGVVGITVFCWYPKRTRIVYLLPVELE